MTDNKTYDTWFKISDQLSIVDMLVFTNIGLYHNNKVQCGLKELLNEMKSTKACISKSIKRWVARGFLKKVYCKEDSRRHYYVPTPKMKRRQGILY